MHLTSVRTFLLLSILTAAAAGQGPLIDEDFSTASGTTPPTGWSITTHAGAPADGFRFDNVAGRPIPAPLTAPVALVDSDLAGLVMVDSELLSPPFDSSGHATLELRWSHLHRPLSSTIEVAVVTSLGRTTILGPTMSGTGGVESFVFDITAACGGDTACRISWRYTSFFDWYWMIDDVQVAPPAAVDLGVDAVTAPAPGGVGCTPLGSSEVVAMRVVNHGTSTLAAGTAIPISYTLDGGPPVLETHSLAASLAPTANVVIPFATPADMSMSPTHNLDVSVTLGGDTNPSNDTVIAHVIEGATVITAFPWNESFDTLVAGSTTPPPGWINDAADVAAPIGNDDWITWSGATPTSGTGPVADATSGTGGYVYVEDSFPGDYAAIQLLTPCLDLSLLSSPHLAFSVHSLNGGSPQEENALSLDILDATGSVTPDVVPALGDSGLDAWTIASADLAPFSGMTVRLRFRASTANGGGFEHDLALDDVRVFDRILAGGATASPGVALLDIQDALDVNGLPVTAAMPGPHAASAGIGDALGITLEGEPGQAVTLFTGPSNPGVLPLGMFGQLDLGLPDGVGGFLGIEVVADGTLPGFLNGLFILPPSGRQDLSFVVPSGLGGTLTSFQAVMRHPTLLVRLSNSVDLTIL